MPPSARSERVPIVSVIFIIISMIIMKTTQYNVQRPVGSKIPLNISIFNLSGMK